MADDELKSTTVYEHYEWECPHCGELNDAGDISPAGYIVECEFCEGKSRAK